MERRADYSVSLRAKQDTGVRIPRDTATEYGQRGALSLTLQLIWPLDLGPEPVASAPRAASVRSVGNISTLWSAVAPSVGPVNVT
jgi:hypothetical protein